MIDGRKIRDFMNWEMGMEFLYLMGRQWRRRENEGDVNVSSFQ